MQGFQFKRTLFYDELVNQSLVIKNDSYTYFTIIEVNCPEKILEQLMSLCGHLCHF